MRTTGLVLLGAIGILGGCSDTTGLNGGAGEVSLSIATQAANQPAFMRAAADTLTDPQNELVLTSVEIVLREVELERISDDACDSMTFDEDSCEKFETGPILLNVPLNGAIEQVLTVKPDTGTYDQVEFDLHKVSNDDPEDAAFRDAHPDMIGQTIRVQGFFNGQPFTYETDIDEEQEHDLVPPLVVDEMTASINVTLLIDVDAWFRTPAGDLVNPQTANKGGENESLVNENIRQSFETFEDDDRDGADDD